MFTSQRQRRPAATGADSRPAAPGKAAPAAIGNPAWHRLATASLAPRSAPGDRQEREAEQAAAAATAGTFGAAPSQPAAAGGAGGAATERPAGVSPGQELLHEVESGSPLEPATRAGMEAFFGQGLSAVRIHTGDRSAAAARQNAARAFAVGNDLVFGAGEYRPAEPAGRRLLAHELTHVLQQRHSAPAALARDPLGVEAIDAEIAKIDAQAQDETLSAAERDLLFKHRERLLADRKAAAAAPAPPAAGTPPLAPTRPLLPPTGQAGLVDPHLAAALYGSGIGLGTPSEGPQPPIAIPWFQGSKERGLAGEDSIIQSQFQQPGAVRLTAGFYGFDVWLDGAQTPLAGTDTRYDGKKATVASGVAIQGGTGIGIKTLDNTSAGYQNREFFMSVFQKYIDDAAWSNLGNDHYALNEMTPDGVRRVEASNPAQREIRVYLRTAPTPDQQKWIGELQQEAATKYVGPGVNAPVRLSFEVPRAEVPPPASVIGNTPVQSRPPLELPISRRVANAEGTYLAPLMIFNMVQEYVGAKVQQDAADAAWQKEQVAIEKYRQENPGKPVTVFFQYSQALDPTGESLIKPVPKFEGIYWNTQGQPPGAIAGKNQKIILVKKFLPPLDNSKVDKKEAKRRWAELDRVAQRADKRAHELADDWEITKTLMGRSGKIELAPIGEMLAHFASAKIALDQDRVGDAVQSMDAGEAILRQVVANIGDYTAGQF